MIISTPKGVRLKYESIPRFCFDMLNYKIDTRGYNGNHLTNLYNDTGALVLMIHASKLIDLYQTKVTASLIVEAITDAFYAT